MKARFQPRCQGPLVFQYRGGRKTRRSGGRGWARFPPLSRAGSFPEQRLVIEPNLTTEPIEIQDVWEANSEKFTEKYERNRNETCQNAGIRLEDILDFDWFCNM